MCLGIAVYRVMSWVSYVTLWGHMADMFTASSGGRLCEAFPANIFAPCKTVDDRTPMGRNG
jgi:hypothetical protein